MKSNTSTSPKGKALYRPKTSEEQPESKDFDQFIQKHGQTGETLYMASPTVFHDRDVYNKLVSIAKDNDGYFSKYSNKAQGIRTGFVFKTQDDSNKFTSEASVYLESINNDQDARFKNISILFSF